MTIAVSLGRDDAISVSKSPTFRSLYASKKSPVMGKAKVIKADRNLFQRLFVEKSSGRTVYIRLKYFGTCLVVSRTPFFRGYGR